MKRSQAAARIHILRAPLPALRCGRSEDERLSQLCSCNNPLLRKVGRDPPTPDFVVGDFGLRRKLFEAKIGDAGRVHRRSPAENLAGEFGVRRGIPGARSGLRRKSGSLSQVRSKRPCRDSQRLNLFSIDTAGISTSQTDAAPKIGVARALK